MKRLIVIVMFVFLSSCTYATNGQITYFRLGSQGTIDLSTDGTDTALKYGGVDISPEEMAAALIKILGATK